MNPQGSLGNILIVDDERNIVDLLTLNLRAEGYTVRAVSRTADVSPDTLEGVHIAIIDGVAHNPDGLTLISQLKETPVGAATGMIYCSSYSDESVLIQALDAGADDCIRKPFSLREMLARVRAVMRRRKRVVQAQADRSILHFKNMTVDLSFRTVTIDGQPVNLSNTEFAILEILMRNRKTYTPRLEIFRKVWPDGSGSNERIVDTNISRLRRKLGTIGNHIANRSGRGYILSD